MWEKKFLKKNPRIVQKKFKKKIFLLKKPYKKIAKNLCNMNPWINNIPWLAIDHNSKPCQDIKVES